MGRLPRPDGKGTFLYLAGLHAPGTLGAASYVVNNLADLGRTRPARPGLGPREHRGRGAGGGGRGRGVRDLATVWKNRYAVPRTPNSR